MGLPDLVVSFCACPPEAMRIRSGMNRYFMNVI